jgi:competence protein ComER
MLRLNINREIMTRYGFIGTGSMGSMLVRKFIGTGLVAPTDITASSKTGISARALAKKTGITAVPSNSTVAGNADVLFVCVKPLEVRGVLEEIRGVLKPGTMLISIAGCVSLAHLEDWAGSTVRCARIIPSVTAEQNAGISLVAWSRGVKTEDKTLVLSLLNAIGKAVETEEMNFNLYADLTSSAPGLFAAIMKEYAGAAVRAGTIQPELAEYLIRETMIGTARLLANEQKNFDDVIGRVATKGGTTAEGVKILHARLPEVLDELLKTTFAKRTILTEQVDAEK